MNHKRRAGGPDGFPSHLYKSLTAIQGQFIAIISFGLSVILLYIAPNSPVLPLKYVFPFCLFSLFLIVWFFHAALTAFHDKHQSLPIVLSLRRAPKRFPTSSSLLILEPSILFAYGSLVAIYFVKDGIEYLIAVGEVTNIQDDKKIQVVASHLSEYEDVWAGLITNQSGELTDLLVKPNVPSDIRKDLQNE